MGQEVGLRFRFTEAERGNVDEIVRRAPHFSGYGAAYSVYSFRDPSRPPGDNPTPDCDIWFEEDGLCLNCLGSRRTCVAVHDYLLEMLGERIGEVTIEL